MPYIVVVFLHHCAVSYFGSVLWLKHVMCSSVDADIHIVNSAAVPVAGVHERER